MIYSFWQTFWAELSDIVLPAVQPAVQLNVPMTGTILEDMNIMCLCGQDVAINVCAGGTLQLMRCKVSFKSTKLSAFCAPLVHWRWISQ